MDSRIRIMKNYFNQLDPDPLLHQKRERKIFVYIIFDKTVVYMDFIDFVFDSPAYLGNIL